MSITLSRKPRVLQNSALGNSTLYVHIEKGLFPPPVNISAKCKAWPDHEIDAVNRARLAGASDDEIRVLVKQLIADRKAGAA